MNYEKQKINETWFLRAHLLFLCNGVKNCAKSIFGIMFFAIIWLLYFMINKVLSIQSETLKGLDWLGNRTNAFVLLFIALALSVIYLLLWGKPKGFSINKFIKIGFTNSAGETPLPMEILFIGDKRIITFYNVGIPLDDWKDKKSKLESIFNINILDIEENGKKSIKVTAVSGDIVLPNYVEWQDSKLSHGDFFLNLGEGYFGKVIVDLSKSPHMLIGGSTGSGKSVLLKSILHQCIKKGAQVIIADFKGGVDYSKAWQEKTLFITEKSDLIHKLDLLVDELHRRKSLLTKADCANIIDYNNIADEHLPRIIFACDEVAEILDKTGLDKKQKEEAFMIEASLSTIARLGRAFGIHLILATQRPDANIISGQIKNNIDIRICGRADNVLSQIILDNTDASDMISPFSQGRFLNNEGVLFQGYWFDEE